ncbi:MAG: phage major capsid protein [Planctomycetota bacterium]
MRELLEACDAEKRGLSEEENERFDQLDKDFTETNGEIIRRRKLELHEAVLEEPEPRKAPVSQPGERPKPKEDEERTRPRDTSTNIRVLENERWNWRTFGEFANGVYHASRQGGVIDKRLEVRAPTTVGTEGTGSDGGFAVPPDFRNEIMVKVGGEQSLMSRCDQQVSSGNTFTVPKDETTPWQSSGGIQAYWEGENAQLTQSKPSLEQANIRLNKLTVLVPVTDELLDDAPAMDAYLRRKAPQKMDFKINLAIIQGTGVGMPLGILNSPCAVSVAKETSQVADTIVGANVLKMWSRMYGPSRSSPGCVWLINQDIEPQLGQMSIVIKNVAGSENVGGGLCYLPANGLSGSPYGTLFGKPVIPTQACETIGDKGDIIFADLSEYLIATKVGGIRAETSIHLWFDYDTTAFRFILRVAGMPWWNAAIDPRDGSNTLSPFVTLAERA